MRVCICNKYVKKINYLAFIIHHVNNYGVSRMWFTENDVKRSRSGTLGTIINITRNMVN